MAHNGRWDDLVRELLERHYDPAYTRSIVSHYPALVRARTVEVGSYSEEAFVSAARAMLDRRSALPTPSSPSADCSRVPWTMA